MFKQRERERKKNLLNFIEMTFKDKQKIFLVNFM